MQENDNVYQNLKGLIWSAFIGIVSFQILAPYIWGYLHKLLGIGYQTAYWEFMIAYILLVPILAVVWLIRDYRSILKYLPPINTPDETDPPYRRFLGGLTLYIIIVTTGTLILFCCQQSNSCAFVIWEIINAVACLLLLISGAYITYCSLVNDTDKKRGPGIRRNYWKLISICFVAYAFLAWVGGTYLVNKRDSNLLKKNELRCGDNGFNLLKLKEKIDSTERNIRDLADSLKVLSSNDSLSLTLVKERKISKEDSLSLKARVDASKDLLNPYFHSFSRYGDGTIRILDSIKKDSPVRGLAENIRQWLPEDSVTYAFETSPKRLFLRHTDSEATGPIIVRASAQAFVNEFTGKLFQYISGIEKQIDKTAKDQLGKQLRDTQAKGMFLFMELFLSLLALYIFLKITSDTLKKRQDSLEEEKRLLLSRHNILPDGLEGERDLIAAEKNLKESTGLTANAWMYITITVWLLIPFFKPVDDDKIDTDAPFKMLTASGSAPEVFGGGRVTDRPGPISNYYYQDTIAEYTIKADSIVLSHGKTEIINIPPKVIKQIYEIDSTINSENDLGPIIRNIKKKMDHIEPERKPLPKPK